MDTLFCFVPFFFLGTFHPAIASSAAYSDHNSFLSLSLDGRQEKSSELLLENSLYTNTLSVSVPCIYIFFVRPISGQD